MFSRRVHYRISRRPRKTELRYSLSSLLQKSDAAVEILGIVAGERLFCLIVVLLTKWIGLNLRWVCGLCYSAGDR